MFEGSKMYHDLNTRHQGENKLYLLNLEKSTPWCEQTFTKQLISLHTLLTPVV